MHPALRNLPPFKSTLTPEQRAEFEAMTPEQREAFATAMAASMLIRELPDDETKPE